MIILAWWKNICLCHIAWKLRTWRRVHLPNVAPEWDQQYFSTPLPWSATYVPFCLGFSYCVSGNWLARTDFLTLLLSAHFSGVDYPLHALVWSFGSSCSLLPLLPAHSSLAAQDRTQVWTLWLLWEPGFVTPLLPFLGELVLCLGLPRGLTFHGPAGLSACSSFVLQGMAVISDGNNFCWLIWTSVWPSWFYMT
jgi:hypothetical protein